MEDDIVERISKIFWCQNDVKPRKILWCQTKIRAYRINCKPLFNQLGAVGGTWTLTSVRSPPPQDGVSAIPPQPRGIQKWCLRTESNCRHTDFQSVALPTELPRHVFCKKKWRPRSDLNWRSSPWQGDMLTATPRGRVSTLVDYSYILTWATHIMQVLFSNF